MKTERKTKGQQQGAKATRKGTHQQAKDTISTRQVREDPNRHQRRNQQTRQVREEVKGKKRDREKPRNDPRGSMRIFFSRDCNLVNVGCNLVLVEVDVEDVVAVVVW